MPMHGHGFALMYLASVYGMESKHSMRDADRRGREEGSRAHRPRPQPATAAGLHARLPATKDR